MSSLRVNQEAVVAAEGLGRNWGDTKLAYDNALAETVIGLYKTEKIRRQGPWRNLEAVEFATLEWIDWFNNRRLLEPIGDIPPVEYEQMYYRTQQTPAAVA